MCTSSPGLAASIQAWMVRPQAPPTVMVVASGWDSGAAQATLAGCWASVKTAAEANRPVATETQTETNRLSMDFQAPRNKQERQPAGSYGTSPLALYRPNRLSPLPASRLYLSNDLNARWNGEGRLGSR